MTKGSVITVRKNRAGTVDHQEVSLRDEKKSQG
jgi:hypothetical protein